MIAKKIKAIPVKILSNGKKFSSEFTIPTENIITGILKIITMILPKEKLFLFNKFIDEEIDPKQDRIKEPIKKLNSNKEIFSISKLIRILAIGNEIKKGNCIKKKCEKTFIKEIIS